ncbi:MAG: hypothetical protein KKB70_06890 [Proteobacteria bacterium]|nr:hypothetical protein [Pseudomonadota bacterium]MBU1610830.1 hypothetical protein [Pseudomonadota bacterium]
MNIGITWARGSGSTLEGKNKRPILGKPLIYYPLMSLKQSGTMDRHYVFTEDDEIAQTVLDVGWSVIPRPSRFIAYRGKGFDWNEAWKHIVTHVAGDLGVPVPDINGSWVVRFDVLADTTMVLNCNNCMVRGNTFRGMFEMLHEKQARYVYPAICIDGDVKIGMRDGSLFPLWHIHGVNRQNAMPLYQTLGNTFFHRMENTRNGKPLSYYYEIDVMEAMDVHSQYDIDLIEFFLSKNPSYFGFDEQRMSA